MPWIQSQLPLQIISAINWLYPYLKEKVLQVHSHVLVEWTCQLPFIFIGRDPRAPRPYLFSDGQNMYNRVVLVCTVNVYIPASLGRRPILRYQVLYRYLKNCNHFTYSLRTDSYYVVGNIVNNLKLILSGTLNNESTVWDFILSIIFRGIFNIFCKPRDQS